MNALWKGSVAALLIAVVVIDMTAAESPASKKQAQERARTMARELVSNVLDVQLTKLEVNGLDKLPIYTEIKNMRKNLDKVVEADMGEIIDLLTEAQSLPEAQREKKYETIREKTRAIVVRLSIERQTLLRRLKLADLSAQIRRLIDMQTVNLKRTDALTAKQAANTLTAIQDEKDLKVLFGQLTNLLRDVSGWGGPEGAAAADGIRILKAAQVDEEIDRAIAALEEVKFTEAAVSEKAVIKGLSALLEKIDEARGLASSDIEAMLKEVAQLTKWQEELKQKTRAENLSDKAADAIREQQAKLHKELDKLEEGLKRIAGTEKPLHQAKASAYEAAAKLFEAKQPDAVKEQEKVLANLATITEQLKKAAEQQSGAKSADELARLSNELKKAREELKESEPHQQKAFEKNAPTETAKENLAEIAKKLENAAKAELPPPVAARVQEAKEAVKQAEEKPEPEKLKEAKNAVERATAEVNAAAADAERRQLAVKIGELGRAAEALERAAAHQRDLSEKANEVAKKDGFTPAEAKALQKEQQEVAKVAAQTAEATKNTAPKAAEQLKEAAKPIQNAEAELANEKQTPKGAETVAKDAKQAAKNLEDAAAKLRAEIKDTAKDLVKVADKQLDQIEDASKEVEKARADVPAADKDRIEELGKAKKMIAEARTEQQRAQGQEKAAKARDLAKKIAEGLEQQEKAEQAAKDLTEGKTARPIDAAIEQQKAADKAGEVAKAAKQNQDKDGKDKTAEHLDKAEKAAAKAAKDLLNNKPHEAEAARKEAREALEKALQEARAQADKHAKEEEGKPNAEAQKRVGDLAEEAAKIAKEDAPEVAKQLEKAGQQAKEAENKLAKGEKPHDAQKYAADALHEAEKQIDKAMKDLAKKQQEQTEAKSEQIGKAGDKSAKLDPEALAALRDAEKNAKNKDGENAPKGDPKETPKNVKETRQNLDKAATALDNRKAQAERDKALAEEVGRDVAKQQEAREQIDNSAKELGKLDEEAKADPKQKNTKAQDKAAKDLGKAMEQFANTQRRIGENAKDIAKQDEVANKPLREALESASKLAKPTEEAKAGMPMNGEPKEGDPKNGEPKEGDPKNGEKGDPKNGEKGDPKNGEKGDPKEGGEKGMGDPKEGGEKGMGEPKEGGEKGMGEPKNGQGKNPDLGTGLVPSSPEQTAAMIAGPQGAKANPGQGKPQPGQQAQNNNPNQPGNDPANDPKNPTVPDKSTKGNEKGLPPGAAGADTTAKDKPGQEEPWMAKLPPDVRKALKSNPQQKPPRGYEDLLRRYFQKSE